MSKTSKRRLSKRESRLSLLMVLAIPLICGGNEAHAQQCTTAGSNQTCVNSIFLSGGASGITDTATLTLTNAGTGTVSGSTFGINAADSTNVTNFGTITSGAFAISAANAANVFNYGTISGAIGISASTSNVTNNMGTISGSIFGISANAAIVSNSGSISGGTFGIFSTTATVSNQGSILVGAGGTGINANNTANITNGGAIAGGAIGISASNAAFVSNSGTISGSNTGVSAGSANLINEGTILGGVAISLSQNSTLVNSGTVIGATGTAINFGGGTNTLKLDPGFTITGKVVGAGNDTFQLGGTGNGTFDLGLIGPARQYQGFSNFNKVDDSSWTVTGIFSPSASWNVQSGTLLVNGDLSAASGVTIGSGGSLGGLGTVPTLAVNNGATLAPGLPGEIGTLHVAGNLVLASAASYLVQVSPGIASSTIVSGTATLNGQLIANGTGGAYTVGQKYTVLSASGATGSFTGFQIDGNFGSTQPTIAYDSNQIFLVLAPANLASHLPVGSSKNLENVARSIDAANVGTPPLAFQNLFNLAPQQLQSALTQLSGEAATGAQESAFRITDEFLSLLVDSGSTHGNFARTTAAIGPTDPSRKTLASKLTTWGAFYGSTESKNADPDGIGSHDLTVRTSGFAAGVDAQIAPGTTLGIASAGGNASWSLSDALGGGHSDVFQVGAYGSQRFGAGYLSGAIAYGAHWISTGRSVTVNGLDQLDADYVAQTFSGRLESGYHLQLPLFQLTPYAALQAQNFTSPRYSESSAVGSPFALEFDSLLASRVRTEVGSWANRTFGLSSGSKLDLWGRVGWAHDWQATPQASATFVDLPAANFVVSGAAPARDLLLWTGAAEWQWRSGWSLLTKLDGESASGLLAYRGTLQFRYAW